MPKHGTKYFVVVVPIVRKIDNPVKHRQGDPNCKNEFVGLKEFVIYPIALPA
jgi:hypothetical protein